MTTPTATREDRVHALVEELHDSVTALTTTEGWQRFLAAAARFHRYSFWNTVAILCQRPEATRVAGYQTWQRLGRQVRRGESGIRILAPCTYRASAEDTDKTDEPDRLVLRGWRVVSVFDIDQTEGEPLPEPPITVLDGDGPAGVRDDLAALIRAHGYEFQLGPLPAESPAGAYGLTDHTTRQVIVRDDLPGAQQAKTTAHELAHVRLHRSRDTDRTTVEIEAESVAYVGAASSACAPRTTASVTSPPGPTATPTSSARRANASSPAPAASSTPSAFPTSPIPATTDQT
jgi:antirestriction protein ArdC